MKSFYDKLNINEIRLLKYDLEINGDRTGWIKRINVKKHYLNKKVVESIKTIKYENNR